eukprot:COSAG06_NODE_2269_length_7201_cov_19.631090_8_plen_175_part_01
MLILSKMVLLVRFTYAPERLRIAPHLLSGDRARASRKNSVKLVRPTTKAHGQSLLSAFATRLRQHSPPTRTVFMLRIISAALALCGAAAAAAGPNPRGGAGAFDSDGGSLQHGEQLVPELGAAPELGAEARTLLEQLIGQVAELRGEVRSLRAGGLRSDERLAALETERLRTAES